MPYAMADVDKHKAGLSDSEKEQWIAIANSVLERCQADGGSEEECAVNAIMQANGVLKKQQEADMPDEMNLQEATWTVAYINTFPDSSFTLILPGGEKDEEGKTTPRSLRKLPYKDADGKVDLAHLRNALARAPQMTDASEGQRNRAITVLKRAAKEHLATYQQELGLTESMIGLEDFLSRIRRAFDAVFPQNAQTQPAMPTSYWVRDIFSKHPQFGDAVIVDGSGGMYAVPYMIDENGTITFKSTNEWIAVMMTYVPLADQQAESGPLGEVGRRLSAAQVGKLKSAMTVIEEILKWADYADGEPEPEEDEDMEAAETDLAESSTGHALALAEVASTDPIVPLHLDVALITPGWGNSRDNHYYPKEVIERDAGVFAGVKMYESDHRDQEKSTRTWVSTVKQLVGFTEEGAPIARVSVHDKSFAERLMALAADDLLEKMECSILAGGVARKGKVDGKKGHIVEAITSAESVDWVTRAGAGGRALALAESEHGGDSMGEQDPEILTEQEPEQEAVTLQEQQTPEEPPAPASVAPERVKELVEATHLPDAAKVKLSEAQYADEGAIGAAITAEIAYLKEVTGSGRPFAQGGGALAPEHKPLSEEDKAQRFNRIMREIGAREV